MLNDTTMTKLETVLGLEGGALKAAIESEDSKEITIPTGQFVDSESTVFTKKELLRRDDKLKETHEQAGKEILVKEYKREKGLEFDGKSLDHLLSFSNEKALEEAGKEPDAKIKELETKNQKLVESIENWEIKHNGLLESNTKADLKRGNDNDVLGFMSGEYSIPKSDMLTIFNSKHNIDKDGENRIVSRNGEKLEDGKTFEPLGLKGIVEDFAKQYAKDPAGGSGGGDEGGGSTGSNIEAFNKRMKNLGHNIGSETYMQEHAKAIADSTLTV